MSINSAEYLISPKGVKFLYFDRSDFLIFLLGFFIISIKLIIFYVIGIWVFMLPFLIILILIAYMTLFYAPYKRAKFIRSGGKYRIKPGFVEVLNSNGSISVWHVAHMGCKVRLRRRGRVDILFGKNLVDFLKHFGSKEAQGFVIYGIDIKEVSIVLERLKLTGKMKGWVNQENNFENK